MEDREELEIGAKDFKKILNVHANEGYKEGITEGRDLEFQAGFDLGYKDGFKSGFQYGRLVAVNEISKAQNNAPSVMPCAICKVGLEQQSLESISQNNDIQAESIKAIVDSKINIS